MILRANCSKEAALSTGMSNLGGVANLANFSGGALFEHFMEFVRQGWPPHLELEELLEVTGLIVTKLAELSTDSVKP